MAIINRFDLLENYENESSEVIQIYTNIINKNAAVAKEARAIAKAQAKEKMRNWLDLPEEVMFLIFIKLGVFGILYNAQSVCSSWRKLCKEPHLFCAINLLQKQFYKARDLNVEKMAREAVDRSCGQLIKFSIDGFITNELLKYIVDKSNSLKCLRLISANRISCMVVIEVIRKVPFLEELQLCDVEYSIELIQEIGRSCPQLKYFRLKYPFNARGDEVVLAIPKYIPQLRRFHLSGKTVTTDWLQDMLDGCPYLEYLDLGECSRYEYLGMKWMKCLERLKYLRLPEEHYDESYYYGYHNYNDDDDDDDDDEIEIFLPKKVTTLYL